MTIYARSPEMMHIDSTLLCVVDVQEKLLPAMRDAEVVQWNIRRILAGARAAGVSALATEQYPAGLGATVSDLQAYLPSTIEKLTFSCVGADAFRTTLGEQAPRSILLVGIETHVCIQQTALDLIAEGFRVYLAVDAVSSRHLWDHETAIRRMETSGVTLTTTESLLFEWCVAAGTDLFREIRALVMERRPSG